ncbi:conserved hypothetical protein [Ricinus communis]|uniref:Uncharacterized protein n=1 Tax=Ricinus communis TaxID=3988 RepID=B9SHA6_RICCO|nr:conserved hypothetical protein [Ricinus communis]|eukprot:XP_002525375.1 histone H3.v1 [Ricinus communis]
MQVSSVVPVHQTLNYCSRSEFTEPDAKLEEDFSFKLRLNEDELESYKNKTPPPQEQEQEEGNEEEEEEEEEEEFSFACTNPDGSPISADDIFQNGQLRPVFPLFNRDLLFAGQESKSSSSARSPLKKLFVEAEEPEGPYCEWAGKAVEASPEVCKKSNSTGFSKLRRFRELVLRSNSDGKDAFVFLHHHHQHNPNSNKTEKNQEEKKVKVAVKKGEKRTETASSSSSSAHERLYVRNRAVNEECKRKSYLPYRVGFFTNASGLSRNVHPY